jgi:NAD(P)-dependent dehydrogenase (short-subunit alcohol dehydrogenase family)
MMGLLDGKVAIVTGGASGIGKATSKRFAEEGAKVFIVDIQDELGTKAAEEINEMGFSRYFHVDVSNHQHIQRFFKQIHDEYKTVNILFNNAGIGLTKTFHTIKEQEWDRIQAVNVKSVFLFSKYAIPLMMEAGGGTIVNMSSVHAYATEQLFSAYASTKGAILSLTRGMAQDYIKSNIRVNAIAPGSILTEATVNKYIGITDSKVLKRRENRRPMGRPGTTEEVANLVCFLSSPLSSYITGSCFQIDGGLLSQLIND